MSIFNIGGCLSIWRKNQKKNLKQLIRHSKAAVIAFSGGSEQDKKFAKIEKDIQSGIDRIPGTVKSNADCARLGLNRYDIAEQYIYRYFIQPLGDVSFKELLKLDKGKLVMRTDGKLKNVKIPNDSPLFFILQQSHNYKTKGGENALWELLTKHDIQRGRADKKRRQPQAAEKPKPQKGGAAPQPQQSDDEIGRASCRERV